MNHVLPAVVERFHAFAKMVERPANAMPGKLALPAPANQER